MAEFEFSLVMRSGVFINIIQAIDDGSPSCLSYLKLLKNLKVFDGDAVVSKYLYNWPDLKTKSLSLHENDEIV